VSELALPIPTTIIADIFGIPRGEHQRFHRWSSAIVSSTTSKWAGLRAIPSVISFMRYIRRLIELRRATPQDDLLSALIAAEEDGNQLSTDELVAMVFLLLVAGHETTVNFIGNAVLALIEQPNEMSRLRDDPSILPTAIEELLRFTGPLETATERYAREDVGLAGTLIPRGSLVFAVLASANRDGDYFHDAGRLLLTREPNHHVAFGQGIHYCVGAPLARLEAQIVLSTLLRRTTNLRLADSRQTLQWKGGLVLRGLCALPVTASMD
jgi:cytochrome P450 PksS